MSAGSKLGVSGLSALIGILLWINLVSGYQINDKFSVSGVLAGAWQYQDIDQAPGFDSEGRAPWPSQAGLSMPRITWIKTPFPMMNTPSS